MAQKTINLGTGELTGDGETLRSAFSKANDNFTELYAGSGGITDIVQDTTPQLGGNLDMNGFEIVTTAGGHIRLDPDTTGGVGIGNVTNPSTLLHLQQSAPIITLQRLDNTLSQGISWTGQGGTEAASIKLDGTGGTTNTLIMSAFDGVTVTERLRIMSNSGAGIQVTGTLNSHTIPGGSGTLALTSDIPSALTDLSIVDGTNGQVLTTDGAGNFTFTTVSGGGGPADTDALAEGATNLYFTNARADARAQLKIAEIVDSAPGTMDTLNELAAALGDDPNFATTTANNIAGKLSLAGGTMAGDIDGAGNKVLFANMYAQLADLPSATTYHGMFAHVHATGAGYFAHAGNWVQLANYTDLSPYLPTANLNTNIDLHLNQAGATSGQILSWDGSDYAWVADQTGGGSQNLFSTVASSGQNNIVADGTTDTLYIEAGSGISITTDQNTDTLTITATGGGLANLVDDTTPQLGGTLDLNLNSITSEGNISIQTVTNPYPIDIGTSSVTGSAVNIGSQALNTPVNISGESNFGAHATFDRGVHERFYTITGATGTVTHNCWWGHVWYHTGVAADFTANITNLGLEQEDATNVAIVINQGNTGYIPNAIEIAGVAQTITWNGNSTPSATDNGIDTFSFTIMNRGGTYIVLGQMVSFGGV